MSREKIGLKQSSTLSAKAAYALLLQDGYTPQLIDQGRRLQSMNWENVISDQNVVHSGSGKSIHLVDASGRGRPVVDLKIKGMMSENSLGFLQNRLNVGIKPAP